MKILVFSHAAGSPVHGPNMRWYYLAQALKKRNIEVDIVGASFFHKYHTTPEITDSVEFKYINSANFCWLKTPKYEGRLGQILNQLAFTLKSFASAKNIAKERRPDIVVASSPPPFSIYAAFRAARVSGAPLIFETRDLWPLVIQDLSSSSKNHPYIKIVKITESFAVRHSEMIASVKPGDIEYFSQEYRTPKEKFLYVPNGFLTEEDVNSTTHENNQSGKAPTNKNPVVIGYLGAMSSYYGLDILLEAAKVLSDRIDIKFDLVGEGEDKEKLKAKAENLELSNVTFHDGVKKTDVPQVLKSFDICYLGLKDVKANQFGISCNKLFEYMYSERPVIASYRTRHDPVQMANCGVTVPPDDIEALVDAIVSLASKKEKRLEMGSNGKGYFLKNHDFSTVAERYVKAFDKLLESKS